jgi:hypothetical protein
VPQLRAQLREGPSQLFQIEVPLEAASSDPPRNNPGHSDTIAPGLPTSKQQSNGQPQKRIQNDHSLYYQCRIASCSLSGDKSFPTCGAKTYLFRVKMIARFTLKSFNHDSSTWVLATLRNPPSTQSKDCFRVCKEKRRKLCSPQTTSVRGKQCFLLNSGKD